MCCWFSFFNKPTHKTPSSHPLIGQLPAAPSGSGLRSPGPSRAKFGQWPPIRFMVTAAVAASVAGDMTAKRAHLTLDEADQVLVQLRQPSQTFASQRAADYWAIRRDLEEQVRQRFIARDAIL